MPHLHRLAARFGLLGLFILGCTPPLPAGAPADVQLLQNVVLPTPKPTATPVPTPTPPPREILPFAAGDHFAYDIRYMLGGFLGIPVGVLSLDIQNVTYEAGVETIDLTLTAAGKTEAHQLVLKDGWFNYDGKPFIPDHMQPGDAWPAQDGLAQVAERESVKVKADYYPGCYPVVLTIPVNQRLRLWFAPGVGLVKGTFKLDAFDEGQIELNQKPINIRLSL